MVGELFNKAIFDVAGRNISFGQTVVSTATQTHDGDGLVIRRDSVSDTPVFYINSSVLGGKMIAEINGMPAGYIWVIPRGGKLSTNVYAGESRIATQQVHPTTPLSQSIYWTHLDPLTATKISSNTDPNFGSYVYERSEPDLQGVEVGNVDPATLPPPAPDPSVPDYFGGGGTGWNPLQPSFYLDGIRVEAWLALDLLGSGAAILDPKYAHDSITLAGAGIRGYFFIDERETRPGSGIWEAFNNFEFIGVGTGVSGYEPDGRLKPIINKIINFLSLLNERSYALGPNLNLLPSIIDDWNINEAAKRIDSTDCYTVVAHGNPSSIWNKSKQHIFPKQLADMIRKDPSYNPNKPVKLYSCNTGVTPTGGGRSFGEQLAREMGTDVIAPGGYVCFGEKRGIFLSASSSCDTFDYISSLLGAVKWFHYSAPSKSLEK